MNSYPRITQSVGATAFCALFILAACVSDGYVGIRGGEY